MVNRSGIRGLVCSRCGRTRLRSGDGCACPPREETTADEDATGPIDVEWTLVARCPDEWTVLTAVAELDSRGIPTWVRTLVVPGYPGLVGVAFPHWGTVSVPRRDWLAAMVVMRDLGITPAPEGNGGTET